MILAVTSFLSFLSLSHGFLPATPSARSIQTLKMGLDPVLSKNFPRDFTRVPSGTDYGTGDDESMNKIVESKRMDYLESELIDNLKTAIAKKERCVMTHPYDRLTPLF